MYCCISLRLSSAFLFFVPLLLLSSIIYSVALLQLRSTLLYTTTVTRQHFHTLHQFYSWAALPCWATVHSRSFCPFGGSPGRSRNQRKTLFPHKQQSIATLLRLNCASEDELDLRALLWLQEFLPFHFPKAGYPQKLVDTNFYQTFYQPPFPLPD